MANCTKPKQLLLGLNTNLSPTLRRHLGPFVYRAFIIREKGQSKWWLRGVAPSYKAARKIVANKIREGLGRKRGVKILAQGLMSAEELQKQLEAMVEKELEARG